MCTKYGKMNHFSWLYQVSYTKGLYCLLMIAGGETAGVKQVSADGRVDLKSRLPPSMELCIAMSLFRRVRRRIDKGGKQVTL